MIACHTDNDWKVLASIIGTDPSKFATLAERKLHEDEVEALVAAWTKKRTRAEVAQALQSNGVEAVPVEDFADLHDDPQLELRQHFEAHTHPFLGKGLYERNGFRMSDAPAGVRPVQGPTLGRDSVGAAGGQLGCDGARRLSLQGRRAPSGGRQDGSSMNVRPRSCPADREWVAEIVTAAS